MSNKTFDMTKGSPLGTLVKFAVPMLLGNLLNQVYSMTDSVVVGHFLGEDALAAVGTTMPVVMLLASAIVGLNIGSGVVMSQYFGANDEAGVRSVFINSLYLGIMLATALAIVGNLLAHPILLAMGTPTEIIPVAENYLRINFSTSICPILYYLLASAFRSMGNSRYPLYCLSVSVVFNIGLDILFVAVLDWGVVGSAWATALAQGISVLLSWLMLHTSFPLLRPGAGDLRLDPKVFRKVAVLAVPFALQSGFNNFGNIVVQSAVNAFGTSVMAAYTVASRIGTLALMPLETIGGALSVYSGQNYGAKQWDRLRQGMRSSLLLCTIIGTALGVVLLIFGGSLARLFLPSASPHTASLVFAYLAIAAAPGFLPGVMITYQYYLRGAGKPNVAVIGGFAQLAVKVAVALIGAFGIGSLNLVWAAWPLSYIAGSVYPIWAAHNCKPGKKNIIAD